MDIQNIPDWTYLFVYDEKTDSTYFVIEDLGDEVDVKLVQRRRDFYTKFLNSKKDYRFLLKKSELEICDYDELSNRAVYETSRYLGKDILVSNPYIQYLDIKYNNLYNDERISLRTLKKYFLNNFVLETDKTLEYMFREGRIAFNRDYRMSKATYYVLKKNVEEDVWYLYRKRKDTGKIMLLKDKNNEPIFVSDIYNLRDALVSICKLFDC